MGRIWGNKDDQPDATPATMMLAGGPFALLVGPQWHTVSRQRAEETLTRMGVGPCPTVPMGHEFGQPCFRIFFGGTSMLMGPASEARLAGMDPLDVKNSRLGVRLPDDWRRVGHIWNFRPEGRKPLEDGNEFYKMLLLLLDMFGATHFFWDAAALWSDGNMCRAAVADLLSSGLPPVLHQVAFRQIGEARVRTRGLSYFVGHEVEAVLPAGMTIQAMVRRLAHLSLNALVNGPYQNRVEVDGLEEGERIGLHPQAAVGDQPAVVMARIHRA